MFEHMVQDDMLVSVFRKRRSRHAPFADVETSSSTGFYGFWIRLQPFDAITETLGDVQEMAAAGADFEQARARMDRRRQVSDVIIDQPCPPWRHIASEKDAGLQGVSEAMVQIIIAQDLPDPSADAPREAARRRTSMRVIGFVGASDAFWRRTRVEIGRAAAVTPPERPCSWSRSKHPVGKTREVDAALWALANWTDAQMLKLSERPSDLSVGLVCQCHAAFRSLRRGRRCMFHKTPYSQRRVFVNDM